MGLLMQWSFNTNLSCNLKHSRGGFIRRVCGKFENVKECMICVVEEEGLGEKVVADV